MQRSYCLVGQPVAVGHFAALRICASARLITETWSSDQQARAKICGANSSASAPCLKRRVLVAHMDGLNLTEFAMKLECAEEAGVVRYPWRGPDRIRQAHDDGVSRDRSSPLRDELISKVAGGTTDAGEGLDLSLIAQLASRQADGNGDSG